MSHSTWGRVVVFRVDGESHARRRCTETISPHVMIDAALHVLAAWVASSQTHSPNGERQEEVDELLEVLPSYIEYHRAVGWLPEPRRSDN